MNDPIQATACARCLAGEPCGICRMEAIYLHDQAGKFAHWAQSKIRRLEAELADQKGLVASLQEMLEKAMTRIAAQSELLSRRAELTHMEDRT